MHLPKRSRNTIHYEDDGSYHSEPKRPALQSFDSPAAAPPPHARPLPRTNVIRAMKKMQGSSQASDAPLTLRNLMNRQLMDAEKEILHLKAAVEEADAAINDRKRELRKAREMLSKLDESLNCEICTYRMKRPVALTCGHTYCSDCIKQWFQRSLSAHVATHGYSPKDLVSPQMWRAIRDLSLPVSTRKRIFADIDMVLALSAKPQYTCPECRRPVNRKPTFIFALQHLSTALTSSQNGQPDSEARPLEATYWDDFFPIDMRELPDI